MDKIAECYKEMKKKYPSSIVLMKVGDFYETYDADAQKCHDVLGVTLTSCNGSKRLLTGFPRHALDIYLPKMNKAGYRVLVVDEKEITDFKADGDGFLFTTIKRESNNNQNKTTMETKKFRTICMAAESAYMFNQEMQALVEVTLEKVEYNINTGKSKQTWRVANTNKRVETCYHPATETQPEMFTGTMYRTLEAFEKGEAMSIETIFYGLSAEQDLCSRVSRNVRSSVEGAYIWVYENGEAKRWYFKRHIDFIYSEYVDGRTKWYADEEIPESYFDSEDVYKYNDYRFIDADGKEQVHEGVYKRLLLESDQVALAEKLQAVLDECKEAGMTIYWSNSDYTLNAVNKRRVERIEYDPCVDEETEQDYQFDDRHAYEFHNVTDINCEDCESKFVIKK